MLFLFSFFCLMCNYKLFAQFAEKQKLLDSLIVNNWKTATVKVGDKFLTLDKVQSESRLLISSNHIAQNISNDLREYGKWKLDAVNMEITIGFGEALKIEPIIMKIIKLEKNKFVFSVSDEHSENITTFECVPD